MDIASACSTFLSTECHAAIWQQWGSTVELTFSIWEILQIVLAILAIIFIKNIFSDPIRRDVFFGYVPTLIVVLRDKSSGKYVLIGKLFKDKEDEDGPSMVIHMPQNSMETTDMHNEGRRVLDTKFGLGVNHYDFTDRELSMGRIKIKGFSKKMPHGLGFSLYSTAKGRIYRVIEVKANIVEKKDGLYILGQKLESESVDKTYLLSSYEGLQAIIGSHEGYSRREGKIPMYKEIFTKLGDKIGR